MEDKELITRCAKQEHEAQKLLYDRYYSAMMGLCERMAASSAEAYDLLQSGFVKVYQDIRDDKNIVNLDKWIKKKITMSCVEQLRKTVHQHIISSTGRGSENLVQNKELDTMEFVSGFSTAQLLESLQRLPVSYRMLVNLIMIENLPAAEVARMMDMSEGTLYANVSKAEFQLKNTLIQQYVRQNEPAAS
jgi:RNA polymerase sigma factor (sigma-70 family)